jgi:molecular chaperone DnaK (HSP70)
LIELNIPDKMAGEEVKTNGTSPADRHAIGIAFGNSNSSIAYTTIEDKAEVIANEEGGKLALSALRQALC